MQRFGTILTTAILFFLIGYAVDGPVQRTVKYDPNRVSNEIVFDYQKRDVLWLARAIYSETKVPEEMVSLAWVVRNRVETEYKGQTYKEVVLAHKQFSGLNSFANHYQHNINIGWSQKDSLHAWGEALKVAKHVYFAPDFMRPFDIETKHFYSPVAISSPHWADGENPVRILKKVENGNERKRFALFKEIDE